MWIRFIAVACGVGRGRYNSTKAIRANALFFVEVRVADGTFATLGALVAMVDAHTHPTGLAVRRRCLYQWWHRRLYDYFLNDVGPVPDVELLVAASVARSILWVGWL